MLCHSLAAAWVVAASACDKPYEIAESIPYDSAGGYQNTLDAYRPKDHPDPAPQPAVVAIHGGAWRNGDKAWGEQFARELVPHGYVVFSINYRLSSRPNGTWPAQIDDVHKAIRFIRTNATRFGIDPARIATLGMSAGGHLAVMAALRPDSLTPSGRVDVAVNLDGEHDMTMPPDKVMSDFDDIMTEVLGHPAPWSDAELRDISTVTFARPGVSVWTVHGAGDDNVYIDQAHRLHTALMAAGAKSTFMPLIRSGNCHEDCWKVPMARRAMHAFLDRTLEHDGNAWYEARHGTRSPIRF
jgi:glycerophosphoryl diester phosphodiesterase